MKQSNAHVWIRHATDMSHHTYESEKSNIDTSPVTRIIWVRQSHTTMSHDTHMNAACHAHGRVTPQKWDMPHIWIWVGGTHTKESTHTHTRIHIPHMNAAPDTREWVMSHIWTRHVTHTSPTTQVNINRMRHLPRIDVACHTHGWVTP